MAEIRALFAKNLKDQLNRHGKKQTDLASFMNVSTGTVSEWCSGKKMPRTNKIQAICNWLFIEMDDLLTDKPATIREVNELNTIKNIVSKTDLLSENKKIMIKDIIEMSDEQANETYDFITRMMAYAEFIARREKRALD